MKRVFALFLAMLLVLCGCAQEPPEASTSPEDTTPPESSTPPATEPEAPPRPDFGLYQPDSVTETQTSGSVRYFPLNGTNYYAVEPMGDGLLLFSGEDTTTLTLLREEADPVTVTLECYLYPDCTMRIFEDGVYYFDNRSAQLVVLNGGLQEVTRTTMPADLVGTPALSGDGKMAYYFSTSALRCFELDTGISRLLRGSTFAVQEVWDIHFDDAVLECFILDGGKNLCQYISTQTGELLAEYETVPELKSAGSAYFAKYFEGSQSLYLVGDRGATPQCLDLAQSEDTFKPLLELGGMLTYEQDKYGVALYFYDLTRGQCAAKTQLYGAEMFGHTRADEASGLIWMLAYDSIAQQQALYCWDTALSPTGDETSYLTPYYTEQEPDREGLALIAAQAKAIGDKYSVRIRVWEEAGKVQPDDYTFETEYLVSAYEEYLPVLEKALSAFPDGFLEKLGKASKNGILTISLVRQLYGNNALGSLTTASGVHFFHDGSGYIAMTMGEDKAEQNLFHEIFHAIDSYVMAECVVYDNWPDLNPDGFIYNYNYVSNEYREDYQYLEDENRVFIDMYSMSFPKEDRARIFEYAMMEGNESYFQSGIMQIKLKTLCKGIREAFNLKKYSKPLRWEQYLK